MSIDPKAEGMTEDLEITDEDAENVKGGLRRPARDHLAEHLGAAHTAEHSAEHTEA
jgi:hypothetical protein